jgi:ketosteroid isomerase-like protein
MTTITVEEFFRRYEHANNDFDVPSIAKLYADTFMFGNPQGVQAVKKEDFVKLLPRRKEFMKTAGLVSSRVDSVEASALDSKYNLVKTVWNMQFRANQGAEVVRKTAATYVLSATGDSFEIVCQLDHQDLMKIVHDLSAPILRQG